MSEKDKKHTSEEPSASVWEQLSQSEQLRKDLQSLYYLKRRNKRNLKIFMQNINRSHTSATTRRMTPYYYAAAMAMLLIGIGGFLGYRYTTHHSDDITKAQTETLIPQTHHDIFLVFPSGEQRKLTESHVFYLESSTPSSLSYRQPLLSDRITDTASATDTVWYNELNVPRGRECEITLTDGTYIKLNSASTLKYPVCFKPNQSREIYIKGEAYLKVRHDERSPFIVHSPRLNIRVLGTTFCVKDYAENPYASASLIEGKIQAENTKRKTLTLCPNEEICTDSEGNTFQKHESDVAGNIAWTQGMLYFNNRTLGEIAKDLERRYDIRIRFDNAETANLSFCIRAQKFQRIEDVLELLRLTQKVNYAVHGRTVTIIGKDL